jgi:hypothetical protein
MRRTIVSLAALVLTTASCRDPLAPLEISLTTDASSYVAELGAPLGTTREHSFTVIATFTNRSTQTVFLSRCFQSTPYPIYGIVTSARDTMSAYDPGWGCVGGHFFHVAAGETRIDTLPVRAPWGINGLTGEPLGVFEGEFALVYHVYACIETTSCTGIPNANVQSRIFRVTRPT